MLKEAPYEIPENDPPPSWPEYGVVKFDDYRVSVLTNNIFKGLKQIFSC